MLHTRGGHSGGGVEIGICDYCGKRERIAPLDGRAYKACAACAGDIRCYQAVTDVNAVAPEVESESARRSRCARTATAVRCAARRRKWLRRLERAIARIGAGPFSVVRIEGGGYRVPVGPVPLRPTDPQWAGLAAQYLDDDEIKALQRAEPPD